MCTQHNRAVSSGKKSANYMIKAVCTTDLSVLAPFAITLNQERSAANVDPI